MKFTLAAKHWRRGSTQCFFDMNLTKNHPSGCSASPKTLINLSRGLTFLVILLIRTELILQPQDIPYFHTQMFIFEALPNIGLNCGSLLLCIIHTLLNLLVIIFSTEQDWAESRALSGLWQLSWVGIDLIIYLLFPEPRIINHFNFTIPQLWGRDHFPISPSDTWFVT